MRFIFFRGHNFEIFWSMAIWVVFQWLSLMVFIWTIIHAQFNKLEKAQKMLANKKNVSDSRNQQMCPPHPDSTSPPSPTQLGKIFFTYRPYICRYDNLGRVMFLIYNMYVCRYWDVSLFTYFPSEIKYACPDIENWHTQSLFGSVW